MLLLLFVVAAAVDAVDVAVSELVVVGITFSFPSACIFLAELLVDWL